MEKNEYILKYILKVYNINYIINMTDFDNFVNDIQQLPMQVGSIILEQAIFMRNFLTEHPEVKTVLETGFHVGLSTAVMLDTRPDIIITSFDIFWFDYTRRAKLLLDIYYPGRNILIAGNSITSIPTYFKIHPTYQPDFVFIDGGHERPVPLLDMYILFNHIREGTWVMIDDYCESHGLGGVIEAVNEYINNSVLIDVEYYREKDRGWILAKRSNKPVPSNSIAENPDEILKLLKDIESHYS